MVKKKAAKKKDAAAVAMAKKRHASLTPERRQEIARLAIATRWAKARKKPAAKKKRTVKR